jgi:hypothetical protein
MSLYHFIVKVNSLLFVTSLVLTRHKHSNAMLYPEVLSHSFFFFKKKDQQSLHLERKETKSENLKSKSIIMKCVSSIGVLR